MKVGRQVLVVLIFFYFLIFLLKKQQNIFWGFHCISKWGEMKKEIEEEKEGGKETGKEVKRKSRHFRPSTVSENGKKQAVTACGTPTPHLLFRDFCL